MSRRRFARAAGKTALLGAAATLFPAPFVKGADPIVLNGTPSHRWYKVIAADSDLIDSDNVTNAPPNSWIRFITLEGPDWRSDSNTQVTLVKNVVAVFDKTIRLDTSSLWTN